MNTNSNNEEANANNTPFPPQNSTPAANSKIKLPGLEYLEEIEKNPPQNFMELLRPVIGEDLAAFGGENGENFMALFCGIFSENDFAVLKMNFPEWVKSASKRFLESTGFDVFGKIKDGNPAVLGQFAELMNNCPPHVRILSPLMGCLFNLAHYAKLTSGHMLIEEQKQFVEGRMAVPKMAQKIKNPSERNIVLMCLLFNWREVEKLGSREKTYEWLKEKNAISPYTTGAEVRRWLRGINLPKGRPGRPPKKNTDTSKNE